MLLLSRLGFPIDNPLNAAWNSFTSGAGRSFTNPHAHARACSYCRYQLGSLGDQPHNITDKCARCDRLRVRAPAYRDAAVQPAVAVVEKVDRQCEGPRVLVMSNSKRGAIAKYVLKNRLISNLIR
jgi:hypothetical protein